ncbi:MAG: ABC transporter permease [Oscillospiraceae bacterium]|nr:ABC transporter permease [Oscillospiraceae bacterium]
MNKTRKSKFPIIFKKELKDLMTPQALIPIVILFFLFYFMGDIIGSLSDDHTVTINIDEPGISDGPPAEMTVSANSLVGFIDEDNSELSNYIKDNIRNFGVIPVFPEAADPETAMNQLESYDFAGEEVKIQTLIVIPRGFEENLLIGNYASVDAYSSIDSFGMTSMIAGASAHTVTSAVNNLLSQRLYEIYGGDPNININYIKFPVYSNDFTYLNNITQNVNASMVLGYVTSQTVFLPIIIFIIIMMSTQMLAASIVNEKTDKTLETIMTTPMSRMSVLLAKILSAAIYAGIYAGAYSVSYKRFMDSLGGSDGNYPDEFISSLEKFGITFDITAFAIIGAQLFLSVLCGLAISMLIGMIIEDMKTLQAYLMPVMFLIMIPYLLSMFLDINTLPAIAKILIYALPFTHTFTAATNLFTQNYTLIIFGIIYQAIFVGALLTVAVKIFNSDKLFTLGQIMAKKNKGRNKKSAFANLLKK